MNRTIRLAILSAALTLSALTACSSGGGESAPAEQAAPAGDRLRLSPATITDWKDVSATITSTDMAEARARIAGILQSLLVREGDAVTRGQVIGRIVDTRLGYESAAFGAQVAAAQAQAAQADAELGRIRYLYDRGIYARARLDQAQAAAGSARAIVAAARAQQSAVGALAGQGAVLAPSSGRVLISAIPAGSAVAPGMSIATITSGPMVLRLDLPEQLAGQVRVGSAVIATGLYPADVANAPRSDAPSGLSHAQARAAHPSGLSHAQARAAVSRVYPSVTAGQMTADVAMPGIAGDLVGRRITARVAIGTRSAIIVPRRAIITRYGIDYVTLAGRGNTVSLVPVQIAPAGDAGRVEILSGVIAGDIIIALRTVTPR